MISPHNPTTMFKVGDRVIWAGREWTIDKPFLFGGWVLIDCDNGYSTAIVTDEELTLITPSDPQH